MTLHSSPQHTVIAGNYYYYCTEIAAVLSISYKLLVRPSNLWYTADKITTLYIVQLFACQESEVCFVYPRRQLAH